MLTFYAILTVTKSKGDLLMNGTDDSVNAERHELFDIMWSDDGESDEEETEKAKTNQVGRN